MEPESARATPARPAYTSVPSRQRGRRRNEIAMAHSGLTSPIPPPFLAAGPAADIPAADKHTDLASLNSSCFLEIKLAPNRAATTLILPKRRCGKRLNRDFRFFVLEVEEL